jgi:outer membrane receptor protein involved in Fe transport
MANSQRLCKGLGRLIDGMLALGVLCMCLAVSPARAQQQGDSAAAPAAPAADANSATPLDSGSLGEVTIIGSRIPRSSVETARPVITLDAKQLAQTGLVNVGEILQHITSAGSAISSKVDVGGNGGTNLDLRNSARTACSCW